MSKLATWLGGHDEVRDGKQPVGRHRVAWVLLLSLFLLVGVEVVAQIRSHLLTGNSILKSISGRSDYVIDAATGLRLLRPNATTQGARQTIRSNSLGLRSDELAAVKSHDETRIVVIGASNVMGADASDNDRTLPARLERGLRAQRPSAKVHVINAGIAGYGLGEQRRMFEYVAAKLAPDLAFAYVGTNNFAAYCRAAASVSPASPHRLPQWQLPRWLMSVDLLLKNTVVLRPASRVGTHHVDAKSVDISHYREQLVALVQAAQERRIAIALSTNARSYRPEQPAAVQERLATTARYYNPCFDVAGLHVLHARHNELIRQVGAEFGVPVVPIDSLVPGGSDYFVDSSHFNERGMQLVAKHYAEFLNQTPFLQAGARP